MTLESHDGKEKTVEGMDLIAEVFETFIPDCADVDTLREFWGKNKDALEILKKGNDKLYQKVLGNFTARSEMLKKKGEEVKKKGGTPSRLAHKPFWILNRKAEEIGIAELAPAYFIQNRSRPLCSIIYRPATNSQLLLA